MSESVWDAVVGQVAAIEQLRAAVEQGPVHAYLFVGPPGSCRHEAARAFAALLMSGVDDPDDRDVRLILDGMHPDVREVRRTGPAINAEQAREIIRATSLAPTEGQHKVMILDEFHLLQPAAAARLLKTIEEPPPSTTFVILCDFVPTDLVTIASRCTRIDFVPIPADMIAAKLVADGVTPASAMSAAAAAMGDLDRARLLATDPGLAERRRLCATIPGRLDGTGSAALAAAAELLTAIETATEPLVERHAAEVAELDERIKTHGERGSGKKLLDERHRRELRRLRADELRVALATIAEAYGTAAAEAATGARPGGTNVFTDAVHRIHDTIATIDRNVNERLLVEHLLWSLPTV